eukprot:TRINITY_DN27768_c0_g1_i1.p1 TRINITY_DN27768_c0_g1~~TRINITY_DN27768_c0_g1_i1.p1  ORF type:complete len:5619 (+),score=1069.33 TRINITY_DN27768_c0_g1_i1:1474-16857(+)
METGCTGVPAIPVDFDDNATENWSNDTYNLSNISRAQYFTASSKSSEADADNEMFGDKAEMEYKNSSNGSNESDDSSDSVGDESGNASEGPGLIGGGSANGSNSSDFESSTSKPPWVWWFQKLDPGPPPEEGWFGVRLDKECPSGPPLRSEKEALKCPESILELLSRFLFESLRYGMDVGDKGWCTPSVDNTSVPDGPAGPGRDFMGAEGRVRDQLDKFRRQELAAGSVVHIDRPALLDHGDDQRASCGVPEIGDFFHAFSTQALNSSMQVREQVAGVFSEASSVAWGLCTMALRCDRMALLRLLEISEVALERWYPRVGYGRHDEPRRNGQLLSEVHVELGLVDKMPDRPSFPHSRNRFAIFPAPTVSSIWPRGAASNTRARVRISGRHFHPSLEPKCLVQEEVNKSWAIFPAVQTSETTMRCALTPTDYAPHTENLLFVFATGVNVSRVLPQPNYDAPAERIEHEDSGDHEETEPCDADHNDSVSNDTNSTNSTFECSPKARSQTKKKTRSEPLGDKISVAMGLRFTELSMPSRIHPNIVQVGGGAVLSVYGQYHGEEDIWCGFEGVRERSRAVRISNLEIQCKVPSRTVGTSRVYLTARDARGLPSVISSNAGMLKLEYVEPVHLFEANPRRVVDSAGVHLKVRGSQFRPLATLRCGFEASAPRRTLAARRVPTWDWDGQVRCSLKEAAKALRTFIMYSAENIEPLKRGEPFVCASLRKQGTWVYHTVSHTGSLIGRVFIPRPDDTLVAEFFSDGSVESLQGGDSNFAGIHFGYDWGDLGFASYVSNLTEWATERVMKPWPYKMPSTAPPIYVPSCTNCTNMSMPGDMGENETNVSNAIAVTSSTTRTSKASTVTSTTSWTKTSTMDSDDAVSDALSEQNASNGSDDADGNTSTTSTVSTSATITLTATTATSTSSSTTFTSSSSTSTTSSTSSTSTTSTSTTSTSSTETQTSTTSSTSTSSTTTTSSTGTSTSTPNVTFNYSFEDESDENNESNITVDPDLVEVWVSGGDFFVSRTVAMMEVFTTTTPKFLSTHLIICPTPEATAWDRKGTGEVKLRVTINGQEWSESYLDLMFLTGPSMASVVAVGNLARAKGGSEDVPSNLEWGRNPSELALLIRGRHFSKWPDVMCELRALGSQEPATLVPSLLLNDDDRACAIPMKLRHLNPESLAIQLVDPDGLTYFLREELTIAHVPFYAEESGGTVEDVEPKVTGLAPDWGWTSGGTLVRISGSNLPVALRDLRNEIAVRCDFGPKAGIVNATSTSPTAVECVAPAVSEPLDVPVSLLLGATPLASVTHTGARFRYLPRFRLAQVTPVVGMSSGGTNVTLTITTQPILFRDFEFDCAFGPHRVRATLVQVLAPSPQYRSYTLACKVPPATNIPRLTEAGCACKETWYTTAGKSCDTYCCKHDDDTRSWCSVQQPFCQGADWGYCDSEEDPILAGSYPVCVRVLPSSSTSIVEYEPCYHRFTYVRQPHVDSISPLSGPTTGGTNVTLHGRFYPQARLGGLLCRFGNFVSPGRWLSSKAITCVTPQSLGDNFGLKMVPVTISINGGADWTPSTAYFSFIPELEGMISPDFGPRRGGTILEVHVPRRFGELEQKLINSTQVISCCFGLPSSLTMPATKISDTQYECKTPPWPESPAVVPVGVAQADGRCQRLPRALFSYVDQWKPFRVYPAEVDEKQQAAGLKLFVSGENFRSSSGAMCRFGGKGGVLSPAEVIQTNYSLLCSLPTTGLNLSSSPSGRTLEVEVAMNGRDFAGGSPPVHLRFSSATSVTAVEPINVSALGNLPLTVKGVSLGADLRFCIFGEDERVLEVPLSALSSEREVVCSTPHWEIRPEGAATERVLVRLAADGVGNARPSSAYVTIVAYPEPTSIEPTEGPVEGGTVLRVQGRHFRPRGEEISIRCVFGQRRSQALVISDSELFCTAPPVEAARVPTGYLSPFDLEMVPTPPNPRSSTPAANQLPKRQLTFYYRRFVPSISLIEPLSGPELGGTMVTLRSDFPLLNSQMLKCVFGTKAVQLSLVTANEAFCISPPLFHPGLVELSLTSDGQNRINIGPGGSEPARFQYYITPTVAKVTPPFGTTRGGTIVQLEGAHFINSGYLSCRFGDVIVPAFRYISSSMFLCKTPLMRPGVFEVAASNNNQNFTGGSDALFEYLGFTYLHLYPYLGPITGNTSVLVETNYVPAAAANTIRCRFGTLTVPGRYVNSTFMECISPAVVTHGEVTFELTLNMQDFTEASQKFLYYRNPRILEVDPPLAPFNQPLSIRLVGEHFENTHYLQVRFGGVSIEAPGQHLTLTALASSNMEAVVQLPPITMEGDMTRVPVYISNNGQNFAPEGVPTWDADEDSHDVSKTMAYFTFHENLLLRNVDPEVGMTYGGGFVSVFGYGFVNSTGLNCSFAWIGSPSVVFISSSHIMCEVPDMKGARSSKALGFADLRVTLNNRDWSRTSLPFRFLGVCPIGHYCQHKGFNLYTFRIMPCDAGHFCETEGMSVPSPCPPGMFMPYRRQVQCQPCPPGFWCPHSRMIRPIACRRGWVCDEPGLIVPYKPCPEGFYCEEGVASRISRQTLQLANRKPRQCPPGLHCFQQVQAQNPKPNNFSTPQPCFQGFFCPSGSTSPYGAGACPLGRYCPTPRHTGIVCPERYMCGPYPGNTEPVPCPVGTFNPWLGQWNCTVCLEGGVCPRSRLRLPLPCPCGYECSVRGTTRAFSLCPAGLMCDEGVATPIEPSVCEPKTFDKGVDTSLDRERQKICAYGIGQQFVSWDRAFSVPRVSSRFGWYSEEGVNVSGDGKAACCWSPELIEKTFRDISDDFFNKQDDLSSRSFARLAEHVRVRTLEERNREFDAAGFDGLALLNVTDAEFREDFGIIYPEARSYLMHFIEKLWNFKRPLPCAAGSFCNEGTCPRYMVTGNVDVDFDRPSQASDEGRRLAEFHYSSKLRDAYYNASWNTSWNGSDGDPAQGGFGWWRGPWNDSNDSYGNGSKYTPWFFDCHGNSTGFGNGSNDSNGTNRSYPCSHSEGPKEWSDSPQVQGRILSEGFQHLHAKGTLGSSAPPQVFDQPMRKLYSSGRMEADAVSLAKDVALKQMLLRRQEELENLEYRLNWTGGNISNASNRSGFAEDVSNFTFVVLPEEDRRLQTITSTDVPLPTINPLAMRAPQQCTAGTFCGMRAASSDGTALCPPGKFCPPGSGEPEEAPEGVFVTSPGSVRGIQCFPGQFAPFKNTPKCNPCPPGASCPDFGTTIPFICPPGTFREPPLGADSASTISCEPCGSGTWSPWRGTPDFSSCEPCPEGRVCPVGTGNVSQGTICPEGHVCGEGTTPEQQTAVRCYDGFFCKSSTTPSSIYSDLCIPGFYCAEATTFVNRYKFRCPVGFYCPEGTGSKDDLKRALLQGVVCIGKREFYLAQKVAQFCVRQLMRDKWEYIIDEQQLLAQEGLPPMDKKDILEIQGAWMQDFDLGFCQEDAVMAVWHKYFADQVKGEEDIDAGLRQLINNIQSLDFLKEQLLKKVLKEPADYINKCILHSVKLDGVPFPKPTCQDGETCPEMTQLECLCTARNTESMLNCFGGDYPDAECVMVADNKDSQCLDPSTSFSEDSDGVKRPAELDDFDLMAEHFLSYVQSSIQEEMYSRRAEGQATRTRCPFGTMTPSDGSSQLSTCVKRKSVAYVQEQLDMVVDRINPVDTNTSSKKWAKSLGSVEVNEGKFWPVYSATAGSVTMVTFDVRQLSNEIRYGKHWKIKFLLAPTLDPEFNDPIDCSSLVTRRTPERDLDIVLARSRGCKELDMPHAFVQEGVLQAENGGAMAGGVFTFMIHPLIDCEWRVEVNIVDGVFQPDVYMLLSSAVVEYVEPARAILGTKKSWAIKLTSELRLELPTNMPMKSFYEKESQKIITQAFLNWLPVNTDQPLKNYMRPLDKAVAAGEKEYVFNTRSEYWRDKQEIFLPYLPYFSNCRGFGRTVPLWAITEQQRGCKWVAAGGFIGLLDLGASAQGDSCSVTEVECILDEVPNVKMSNPRWFEAPTGTMLFEMTKDPLMAADLDSLDEPPVTEPVYIERGIPAEGALPRRVTLAFQYWQRSPEEKMLAYGKAWYGDFQLEPDDKVRTGKAAWTYKLVVLYYPMTHFEVLVNFAFPQVFYLVVYVACGCTCVMIVMVLWGYHRFMCKTAGPPKLLDFRHWNLCVVPQLRAIIMVVAISVVPIFIGLGTIRGEILGNGLPIFTCPPEEQEENCQKGPLDMVQSSFSGETAVSTTSMGERRTGRVGTMLTCIGGYAIAISLKLLVPPMESNYYKREDKSGANKLKDLLQEEREEQEAKGILSKSETQSEAQTAQEEEGEDIPPIFLVHLWKRSSLALLVYINAAFQIGIMRLAFSSVYQDYIMILVVLLFVIRVSIKVACTNFMCELMLTVPLSMTNQTIAVVTLLSAPTLFDFIVVYMELTALQMLERLYIGPNEDVITNKLLSMKRGIDGYLKSLQKTKQGGGDDADPESDEEKEVQDDGDMELEGENEELIQFLSTVSGDAGANLVVPIFFAFAMWYFDETQILNSFGIPSHNASYYILFYLMMYPFQSLADKICINIAECYHGWRVTDYLEYCAYRFLIRTTDWKAKDNALDQTLSPHVRSIDQMCFSDQYYYVCMLQLMGVLAWMFGMQIIFVQEWNVFDDPATPVVLFFALALCRGCNAMTGVSAGYLKIWVVRYRTFAQAGYQQALMNKMQSMTGMSADEKPPVAPPGSVHDGWPEPAHYDKTGMERYRVAFMAENQLWLQVAISEMKDKKTIHQNREQLLDGLSSLLGEVAPKDYAPEGTDGVEKTTFAFGAQPPLDLARAAGEVQRETYENSALRQLVRMWRERAQFMLHLQQVSSMVKLNNYDRRDACEICGKSQDMGSLVVLPIYTLLHLASLYREQRDMSPLWNTPLWKHFYQTFTPTCTLCEDCAKYYHKRNTNIPVNEKRFQRLQVKKKTAYEMVRRSEYPIIALDADLVKVLHMWLDWTRCFANGEHPQDFLPRFGFEGRTAQEIRREKVMQKGEDEESLPSLSGSDDDKSKDENTQKKPKAKDPLQIDMEADDMPNKPKLRAPKALTWAEQTIMMSWLHRARDSLQAPQMASWAYPGESGPALRGTGAASSSGAPGTDSADRASVHFGAG